MRKNAHWYTVTAFDEKTDFFGEHAVTFKFHMDLNDHYDVETAREVAMNKIFADQALTYDEVKKASIVMNFVRA